MTKRQAKIYAVIYFLMILLGAYMIFKLFWAKDWMRYLSIISIPMIAFGALYLSISLTRIIIPVKTDFRLFTFRDKKEYTFLKKEIGARKVKAIEVTFAFLLLNILGCTVYSVATAVNRRERHQLKTFGRLQKVIIKDIHYKGKGGPHAFFDFYFDGKKYTDDLSPKNYRIGDSTTIIFSTNDPSIVEWWDYEKAE